MAAYNTEYKVMLVATSDGLMVGDIQPLSRFQVTCIAEENGNRQVGNVRRGGRIGLAYFQDNQRYSSLLGSGSRGDSESQRGRRPAEVAPVVLAEAGPGIPLYEAIGHGLEADFNRKKTSAFPTWRGNGGPDVCTIVDDGTLPFRRGSAECGTTGGDRPVAPC